MASERLVSGITYYIITLTSGANNRVLEVNGGGQTGNVDIWTNVQSTNEQWTAQIQSDGTWAFAYRRNPRAYLTTNGQNNQVRAAEVDPSSTPAARWKAEDLGDGYLFSNLQDCNYALDVSNNGTSDGTPVLLWSRHGAQNQRWRISRVA
ncbi:ricin B lectin domain-containing protein [Aspergillus unguis]